MICQRVLIHASGAFEHKSTACWAPTQQQVAAVGLQLEEPVWFRDERMFRLSPTQLFKNANGSGYQVTSSLCLSCSVLRVSHPFSVGGLSSDRDHVFPFLDNRMESEDRWTSFGKR